MTYDDKFAQMYMAKVDRIVELEAELAAEVEARAAEYNRAEDAQVKLERMEAVTYLAYRRLHHLELDATELENELWKALKDAGGWFDDDEH